MHGNKNLKKTKTGLVYSKKGSPEAYEWADRMQALRKKKKSRQQSR